MGDSRTQDDWLTKINPRQLVLASTSLGEALRRLDETAGEILFLMGGTGALARTVTDGDLRRLLLAGKGLDDHLGLLPQKAAVVASMDAGPDEIIQLMNRSGVNQIPVVDGQGLLLGVAYRRNVDQSILLSTPHMGDQEQGLVGEAFKTNWVAPVGPHVDFFESELSEKVGIEHAVAVSSGTAALHLAMCVLEIGPGDVVFCASLTFVATVNPIRYVGATPVFIDSDPETWNMSPRALRRAFEDASRTNALPRAVVVVNLYGQSADYQEILDICNEFETPVVEDAAESLGAKYKGLSSGTLGLLGIYSFNRNKIITTSGGGMLVSNNGDLIEKALHLSTQAREPCDWYEHKEIGYNYRLSNILAGIGRGQLRVLESRVEARRTIFRNYVELLESRAEIDWMPELEGSFGTRWLSTGLIDEIVSVPDLVSGLANRKIEVRQLWKPMHLQPVFQGARFYEHEPGHSVSDFLFHNGICLPSSSHLTMEHQSRVVDALVDELRKTP